jgi:hypothetical protein
VRFSANPDHWATDWNGILCVFAAGCLGIAVGVVSAKTAVDAIGGLVRIDDMPHLLSAYQQGASPLALARTDRFETVQPHSASLPGWAAACGDD